MRGDLENRLDDLANEHGVLVGLDMLFFDFRPQLMEHKTELHNQNIGIDTMQDSIIYPQKAENMLEKILEKYKNGKLRK